MKSLNIVDMSVAQTTSESGRGVHNFPGNGSGTEERQ